MYVLNDLARSIPNFGFSIFGIYMAHSFYRTPRKIWQCLAAWIGIYTAWIIIGIPLDGLFVNNPLFPGVTHERVCMFIGPLAIFVYCYLFPQVSVWKCVFCYFMVDNCMILLIILARTISTVLSQTFGFSHDPCLIIVYLLLAFFFLLLYEKFLKETIRQSLDGFGKSMKMLSLFALLSYFGTLFQIDVWAPWDVLKFQDVAKNLSIVCVPVVGYGLAFRIASEHAHTLRLEEKVDYDTLTGLKNRHRMFKDAKQFLENTADGIWLFFMDLDSFKIINDKYGHSAGDAYLCRFARNASRAVSDLGELYRMSGDEFVAIYRGECPDRLAKAICRFSEDHQEPAFLGVSIGYEFLRTENDLKQVLHNADQMMYKNKAKRGVQR